MIGFAELKHAFDELDLAEATVIAHASMKKFDTIRGAAKTLVQAMVASFRGVIMPTFTYKTMITPEVGPPNNGIKYGSDKDLNKMAEPFRIDMPPDKMMGVVPLALFHQKEVLRTSHPILSFAGINADEILLAQTLFDPLAPIRELGEKEGWVVLINLDHVRWAMTPGRIVECPGFPGDSSGFNAIEEYIKPNTRRVDMDNGAFIQAVRVQRVLEATVEMIKRDPLALLCEREDCERCNAVRNSRG